MKLIELRPIKITTEDFEAVEKRIRDLFLKRVYFPLLKILDEHPAVLLNSADEYEALIEAITYGRITFHKGVFSGKFNAGSSQQLKKLGAVWDKKTSTFHIHKWSLPASVRAAIDASLSKFEERLAKIDELLAQILPEKFAGSFKMADLFDRALWKVEDDFQASVKNITVAPKLTKKESGKIADEWQNNMELWIKDFSEKEIKGLRRNMQKSVFAGNRYESAVKTIQTSYGVTERKAKFLARQETSLLMAKFKETRYESAGVSEYKWNCVTGSKLHPVRPKHKALADASKNGKLYRWDNPPNTAEEGTPARFNNPGQDYNCRCSARPVVRFRKDAQKL